MRSPNNLLLSALSVGDLAALSQHFTKVSLTRSEVLFEPGNLVRTVHFPIDCTVVAIVIPMLDGSTVETVTIGNEGAVGGVVSHGLVPAFGRALFNQSISSCSFLLTGNPCANCKTTQKKTFFLPKPSLKYAA